jgi:preprotein translocase subunit SecY
MLQGYGMIKLLQKEGLIGALSPEILITTLFTIAAGCIFLMWLGELITEKGIGNGVSLLIFAGIVSQIPSSLRQIILSWDSSNIPNYIIFLVMSLIVTAAVVLVNEARRNIPISYSKRVRGAKMYGGVSTYLPLNINPAGVIPIIFALSIVTLPLMLANFFATSGGIIGVISMNIAKIFQDLWFHNIIYFLLVVLFTYFYTAVTFDPKAIATNLQKMGGFIPGIRPGESTAKFMYFILNRVLLIGAIFLGLIAIVPSFVGAITGVHVLTFMIGGTSLLIVVSVVLETLRQINAQLQMREYDNF